MSAANERPITCPCCLSSNIIIRQDSPTYGEGNCNECGCGWPTHKRRAQTADLPIAVGVDMSRGDDMTARAYLYEGGIMCVEYEPPSQPAEAVDEDKEYLAFEKWFDATMPGGDLLSAWPAWMARARGGQAD